MYNNNNGLYRSRTNRILTGVCGGIAERLGVHPWLVRILALLLVPALGSGLVIYLVCTLLIPEAPM